MFDHACLFCRFSRGETPCHEVHRTDRVLAFLDNAPIRPGHVLIVPAQHYETFDQVPPAEGAEIMHLAQRIATLQKRLFNTNRVAFLFTGGDIPHVHAHLFPMQEKDDITSRRYIQNSDVRYRPLPIAPQAALAEMAETLSKNL